MSRTAKQRQREAELEAQLNKSIAAEEERISNTPDDGPSLKGKHLCPINHGIEAKKCKGCKTKDPSKCVPCKFKGNKRDPLHPLVPCNCPDKKRAEGHHHGYFVTARRVVAARAKRSQDDAVVRMKCLCCSPGAWCLSQEKDKRDLKEATEAEPTDLSEALLEGFGWVPCLCPVRALNFRCLYCLQTD